MEGVGLTFRFPRMRMTCLVLSLLSRLIGDIALFAFVNQSGVPLNAFLPSFQEVASVLAE